MMVVVQFLAGDEEADGPQVRRCVVRLEVAVALRVAKAVDHARREHRHRAELKGDHRDPRDAEQHEIDDHEQDDAGVSMRHVDVSFQPVVGRAPAVLLHGLGLPGLCLVQFGALPDHLVETEQLRAVRIAFLLAVRVVLAVHRDPFLRRGARVHPEPEAAKVPHDGVQVHGPVRLIAMEIERDRDHRDVHPQQRDHDIAPEAEIGQAVEMRREEFDHERPNCRIRVAGHYSPWGQALQAERPTGSNIRPGVYSVLTSCALT